MGFSLTTAAPAWFFLLCLITGALFALLLYYRDSKNEFSRRIQWLLAVLRGLAVSTIAFLLMSPLVERTTHNTEKPIIVIASDNSASVAVGKDSSFYRQEFQQSLNRLAGSLEGKFEVRKYSFGEKVTEGFDGKYRGRQTDIAALFGELQTVYSNRNLASVVLVTDGIYNAGSDPVYAAEDVPFSIYSVAMGDTTRQKDIAIARVGYNQIAYLGNDFMVEITVSASRCAGAQGKVTLTDGSSQLFAENYSVGNDKYISTFAVKLKAARPGMQHYRIAVSPVAGEITKVNNYSDIYIDVLDGRQKILQLYSSPHPDISAVKQSIETNRNYEVETKNAADFNGSLAAYTVVILHQLPSDANMAFKVLSQLKTTAVPVLYLVGGQTNLPAFNNLGTGLSIPVSQASNNDASPILNKDFSLFSVSQGAEKLVPELPPLNVPFGQYKAGPSSQVLMYQKIGNVNTQFPLIVLNQGADRRSATIVGEGIWRWRLTDYLKSGSQQSFDELMSKIVQFLALKDDRSRFRVRAANRFAENREVEFDAELYNENYELVNSPEVNMVITDQENRNYPYAFTRTASAYYLNAGTLPPGDYKYKAVTSLSGTKFEKTGIFTVTHLDMEFANITADHSMLSLLASKHQGKMVYPRQLDELAGMLNSRSDIKQVIYTQKSFTELVSFLPLLLAIIALLSTEWFIRKRSGSY